MSLKYTVPHNKQIRVIIDTDAACEADDPFAIVQALLSPKLVLLRELLRAQVLEISSLDILENVTLSSTL